MSNEIELRLAAGIKHSARDVILPAGMSEEQWVDYGRFCRSARAAAVFWEARWLQYGRTNFGAEAVQRATSQLEFEFRELKALEQLNRLEVRSDALSVEHHFALSKAKLDATGQQMWAELAARNQLSAHELQESIKKGTVTRLPSLRGTGEGLPSKGLVTFQGIMTRWGILMRQIAPLLGEWTPEVWAQVEAELAPIEEFLAEGRVRFGAPPAART